ncbi:MULTISPECIES: BatA and WFA domain-containing protein [unclassified Clostridium]|uniref:vWA domain-containing protein n=1 Tax=unclassified Clostridium TaxID=2614128 RepID=UPI0002984DE9|nr:MULTISPECIES: BatA and WFA domain-containing protein [unclassified Clostridium]EKQ51407.1 MAG: Aerotolerance regulator [Clostridium sp. Maddingley MBC34-26]
MGIGSLWPLVLLITIPLVVLLYILKRKYRERKVSSSLLWKEAYRNTQANTPWEKLKVNIMMILQILIILLIIFALLGPFLRFGGKTYKNIIIVMDATASMSTLYEGDKTRLDKGKEVAEEYIKSIKESTNNYIIAFNGNSNIEAKNNINEVNQTYGKGDINSVLSYVRSLTEGLEEYEVLIVSDKNVDLGDINGKAISLANSGENAAITNLSHKFSDNKMKVIATVKNTGNSDYSGDFSLYNGEELVKVESLELPKGTSQTLNFEIEDFKGDYLKGELSKKDLIAGDNTYYDVVSSNKGKKVLLVTDKNVFLEKSLSNIENVDLYKTNSVDNIAEDDYDLYVFDNVMPKVMPKGGSILFINPTSNEFFKVEDKEDGGQATGVEEELSKYTKDIKFTLSNYKNIEVPYFGKAFLKVGENTIGFLGEVDGRSIGALGFDIHNSDLALKKEFPIMIYELGEKLIKSGILYKNNYKAGDEIIIKGTPLGKSLRVKAPNKNYTGVTQGSRYNSISELGLYKVEEESDENKKSEEMFSINFPADEESNLSEEKIGEEDNLKSQVKILKKGLSLVPLLLMLAIAGLLAEWILYLKGN